MREEKIEGVKQKRINAIADKICRMAIEGDVTAIKEIGDRLDGKPAQAITGEGGGALEIVIAARHDGI
jgi:hypothetical protein